MPGMENGDVMGHEFMGEVVEVGPDSRHALKVGDRVVIPFTIFCGECDQCQRGNFSVCERSNRNKDVADKMFGHATAGLFGYTHLTGGYAGGQAEYVRVPFAERRTSRYLATVSPMSRCCSLAISSRPAGRRRFNAISSPPTQWRYGVVGRWVR